MSLILNNSNKLDLSMTTSPTVKAAPKIKGLHPLGSNILIELLTSQELFGANIIVSDDTQFEGPPQAYVLEVGPAATDEIKSLVGKRVVVNGRGVNVPVFGESKRVRLLVEYPMIKGIIEEEG
jgi:co-chaperonin GroES (HSP10)